MFNLNNLGAGVFYYLKLQLFTETHQTYLSSTLLHKSQASFYFSQNEIKIYRRWTIAQL